MAVLAGALSLTATPALGSVLVENYIETEIDTVAACFHKQSGADVGAYGLDLGFDNTVNTVDQDGVQSREELVDVIGMVGDRVIYSDVIRYVNDCDVDLNLRLQSGEAAGDWTDRTARIHLSTVPHSDADPTTAPPTPATPSHELDDPTQWDQNPISIEAGGAIGNDATGWVTLPAGEAVRGALVVWSGADASAALGAVNWIAHATHGVPAP